MNKFKSILLLPALLSVASCPIKAEPAYQTNEPSQIVQVEESKEDRNSGFIENYIVRHIKHPEENYNYIATYEGDIVFSNAVVRLNNEGRYFYGDVYLYIINISYFDDEGMTKLNNTYALEIVVEPDGDTGIIHVDKE